MTPAARAFWERAQRRAAGMQPDIAAAVLRAFAIIRDSLSEAQLMRIVDSGDLDRLFREALTVDVLDRAFLPLRQRMRQGVERQLPYFARDMPRAGKVDGVLAIEFDYLNPRVIDAVRALETKVVTTLQSDVRETVRAHVENGLRDGVNPRTVARQIRSVVGLAPNQEREVAAYRRKLESAHLPNSGALDNRARDHRYDAAIRRARATGTPIPSPKIDTMHDAYRRRRIALNANTVARTASLEAMKVGQRLSWADAIEKGIVDGGRLRKRWATVLDGRERPEHHAMNGAVAPFDEPYSNGDMYAGEGDPWNCFAAGTVVEGAFVIALKGGYTGPLWEIETARGHRLTVTPNHPILTTQGWVPAHALRKGGHVFSKLGNVDGAPFVGVDHQDGPTRVEDVFDSFGPKRVPDLPSRVALDLHGDAVHFTGNVDIVGSDGIFPGERVVSLDDGLDNGGLKAVARSTPVGVDGSRANGLLPDTSLASPGRAPGFAQESLGRDRIPADVLPAQPRSFGPSAQWGVPFPEIAGDGGAGVPGFLRELEQASAGAISLDQIVNVSNYMAVRVHVYDLQSVTGWLLAGNILCSNCRCIDVMFVARAG